MNFMPVYCLDRLVCSFCNTFIFPGYLKCFSGKRHSFVSLFTPFFQVCPLSNSCGNMQIEDNSYQ